MGYTHGHRWSDEEIIKGIYSVMSALNIQRMPSRTEMRMVFGNNGLSNTVSRKGGFYKWAEKLNIPIKRSETQTGKEFEEVAISLIKSRGYTVQRMSTKYPYDLLINENVKIDVKAARAYFLKGSRVHTVGINKKYATCDIYLIFALGENDNIERKFIIPGNELKLTSLNFGENSKYNKYIDRWDYLDKFNDFYKKLS